jgi:hypothetical protein
MAKRQKDKSQSAIQGPGEVPDKIVAFCRIELYICGALTCESGVERGRGQEAGVRATLD